MKDDPKWSVKLTSRAEKAIRNRKIQPTVKKLAFLLMKELELLGPMRSDWDNFGPINDYYHCHIKKGRPTYVVCWRADKKSKEIEVFYVGTHEGAPY